MAYSEDVRAAPHRTDIEAMVMLPEAFARSARRPVSVTRKIAISPNCFVCVIMPPRRRSRVANWYDSAGVRRLRVARAAGRSGDGASIGDFGERVRATPRCQVGDWSGMLYPRGVCDVLMQCVCCDAHA